MRNSAINFSVCVSDPGSRLDPLLEALKEEFDIRIDQHLELITIRHYDQPTIDRMKQGKLVLLEESIRETYQMVVKAVPPIRRLDNS